MHYIRWLRRSLFGKSAGEVGSRFVLGKDKSSLLVHFDIIRHVNSPSQAVVLIEGSKRVESQNPPSHAHET